MKPAVTLAWMKHFAMLGLYTVLYHVTKPLRRFQKAYRLQRWLDAFQYGSGHDHASAAPREAPALTESGGSAFGGGKNGASASSNGGTGDGSASSVPVMGRVLSLEEGGDVGPQGDGLVAAPA